MRGYHNYKGRGSAPKKLAVIAMSLILLLAVGYLALSEFAEYDSDGNMHLVFPSDGGSTAEQKGETGSGDSEDADSGVQLVYDDPEDPLDAVQATELAVYEARQGSAYVRSRLGEGNAAAIWLKRADGMLRYRSSAADASLCFTDGLSAAELQQFTSGDTYTIARISCMKDNAASMKDMVGCGLTQENGYIWYGSGEEHYLDISKPAARSYLISLVKELGELGFDEVLLSDLAYPTGGKQESISTTDDRTGAVTGFLKELKTALKGSELRISLEISEKTVLDGGSEAEGISLAEQLPLVQRVYVKTQREDAVRAAIDAVRSDMSLVVIGGSGDNRYTPATYE